MRSSTCLSDVIRVLSEDENCARCFQNLLDHNFDSSLLLNLLGTIQKMETVEKIMLRSLLLSFPAPNMLAAIETFEAFLDPIQPLYNNPVRFKARSSKLGISLADFAMEGTTYLN